MQRSGIEANRRLAELLGWTEIFDVGGALLGTPPPGAPACRNQAKVPDWTGDWRDCGPLMTEYVDSLGLSQPWARAAKEFDVRWCRVESKNRDEATSKAVVEAVIAKLLEAQG